MLQFASDDAYARCLAPYVTDSCNHSLSCAVDCVQTSCNNCSSTGRRSACEDAAFTDAGECRAYVPGYYCAAVAVQGPGGFCDFDRYNDLGQWWQAVGQTYCSP
jgi:hypothetical protein